MNKLSAVAIKDWISRHKMFSFWLVLFCFLCAELLLNPTGEFPLNDDWQYSKAVNYFVKTGQIGLADQTAIPLVTQFVLGVIVTKIVGTSFFVHRLISVSMAVMLIYLMNNMLSVYLQKNRQRIFVLLLLVFNPLFFSLSNTFMPDVIAVFFAVFSFYYIIKLLQEFRTKYYLFLILFTLLSTMTRQTGVLVPFTFMLLYFWNNKLTLKIGLIAMLPLLLNTSFLVIYEIVMRKYELLPICYNMQFHAVLNYLQMKPENGTLLFFCYLFTAFTTLGLFVLPIVLFNLKRYIRIMNSSLRYQILFCAYFIFLVYKLVYTVWFTPYVGNMFYPGGTGPVIMDGLNTEHIVFDEGIPRIIVRLISLIGGMSYFLIMISVIESIKKSSQSIESLIGLFYLILSFSYLGLVCLNFANDRYLLFLLPFLLMVMVKTVDWNSSMVIPCLTLLLIVLFTFSSTYDYFRINEAKWNASNHVINDLKVPVNKIDAGFEFNDYHKNATKKKHRVIYTGKEYIVTTTRQIKGYSIESAYYFKSLVSFSFDKIYVQKRD